MLSADTNVSELTDTKELAEAYTPTHSTEIPRSYGSDHICQCADLVFEDETERDSIKKGKQLGETFAQSPPVKVLIAQWDKKTKGPENTPEKIGLPKQPCPEPETEEAADNHVPDLFFSMEAFRVNVLRPRGHAVTDRS